MELIAEQEESCSIELRIDMCVRLSLAPPTSHSMHAIARALMHPGPAEAQCMQIERQSSSPPSERLTSQRHNMVSKSLLKEGMLAK